MAADIWTLNLICDGAAPGQECVQREMDKDEICFFSLVDLIKEYGYTSRDNLYYESKDGMVVIELDTNVMEMLEEYESEKEVTLFVTRQKMAFMAPTKFNREPTRSVTSKTKGIMGTKKNKQLHVVQTEAEYADEDDQHDGGTQDTQGDDGEVKKRGGTVLTHVWDLLEGKRILVKCNKFGQPIGKEGGLLGQFLGTIARNGGYCPLDTKDWRKIKKDNAHTIIQLIQTKFLYPHSCEKWILKSIGRDWRKYKATLKKKHFNPKKKRSTLYKLCPDDVDVDQWMALVRYWKSTKGKSLSEKNKISRGMKKTTHTAGTKSYARWSEDLSGERITNSRGGIQTKKEGDMMSKSRQGVLEGTTALAPKEAVCDKVACHKRSKHTLSLPIKVGSTVLLKTAKYPNKATVAYATLLSTSPKAIIGGVEVGNQFYKVRINHPIQEDEPLVRPMSGYTIIGDAHAKGAPIAWPSICVQMING